MADTLNTESLLRLIAENTGKRISLGLDDLDQYLSVARAAIAADRRSSSSVSEGEMPTYGATDFGYTLAGVELEEGDKRVLAFIVNSFGSDHPVVLDLTALLFRRAATKAAAPADAPMSLLRKLLASGAGRTVLDQLAQGMHTNTDEGKAWLAAKALVDGAPAEDAREEVQQKIDLQICVLEWNRAQSKPPIEIGKEYFVAQEIAAMLPRRASSVPSIPGTKVVPLVATSDMIHAGMPFFRDKREPARKAWQVYKAMIAAAPSHPSEAKAAEDAQQSCWGCGRMFTA